MSNYNGIVGHDDFSGTYAFTGSDGTFTVTINNLPFLALPTGVPNEFTFDGVLGNKGTMAKIVLSGVSVGGQKLEPNISSVIAAEFIKQ